MSQMVFKELLGSGGDESCKKMQQCRIQKINLLCRAIRDFAALRYGGHSRSQ